MTVRAAKARQYYLAADFFPLLLAQKQQIRRIEHPNPSVTNRNSRWNVQSFSKHIDRLRSTCLIEILQHLHAVAAWSGGFAGIFDTLGNPNAAALVKSHGDGIHDLR